MKQTLNITHAFLLEVSKHLPRRTEYTLTISENGIELWPPAFASNRRRVKLDLIDHIIIEHLPDMIHNMHTYPLFQGFELIFKITPGQWIFSRTGRKNRRWRCVHESPESLMMMEVIKK